MGVQIAILMACHNRVQTTLTCLRHLDETVLHSVSCRCKVFLVDDGSTDGTSDCIRRDFPSVRLIRGDGSLYWARSMRLAWEEAVAEDGVWDAFLWLNDDVLLNADALSRLLAKMEETGGRSVVVGTLVNGQGDVTYGVRGDVFTGNCVLVPNGVYAKIGMLCGDYRHAWADTDYALMCRRAGIGIVDAGVVGRCEGHPNRPSLRGLPLLARLRQLVEPKGWNLHDLWVYRRRNWGLCRAVASCLHLMAHVARGER